MSPQKIGELSVRGEQAVTLVTFLVSLPTCTLVGLGDGLRLFRSFSSLLGGLDLMMTTDVYRVFRKCARQVEEASCNHMTENNIFSWEGTFLLRS